MSDETGLGRTVCWFSAGAASAVATKLTLAADPAAVPAYCETGAEHKENERFLVDCAAWFGTAIERLRSDTYADTWAVWASGSWQRRQEINLTRLIFQLDAIPEPA